MLKDIRIHLDANEEQQSELEKQLAESAIQNYRRNVTAFRTHIPSLATTIERGKNQNISIFINRNGDFNIVNFNNGLTLYDLDPIAEINAQYHLKRLHCTYCDLQGDLGDAVSEVCSDSPVSLNQHYQDQPQLTDKIDVLVVAGLGLGFHIRTLIENHDIDHLIIYEPEVQYFFSSVYAMDWKEVLDIANKKGTGLYFQLGNDGTSLSSDITQLREHVTFCGFYYYRHYNHKVFNALDYTLMKSDWDAFVKDGISQHLRCSNEEILPSWNRPVDYAALSTIDESAKFSRNIEAFRRYVPDIAQEFDSFEPSYWYPVTDEQQNINVVSKYSLANWYTDTWQEDASLNFENFSQYPNKDGVVLDYDGVKLKHYHHYQFVINTQKLLKEVEDKKSKLPDKIKSLILFGIGPQLESLFAHKEVEKLFICEPNRDLFYASLFMLDWAKILEDIDSSGGRLYINVGDDGSNLFRDLLNQFYSVGPYILANTYFYQTYHNEAMVQTISQLREELQVVIAMGENFDHARYGIAHTKETLSRGYPLLKSTPSSKLSIADKDVPVFIVGNGPSLDETIESILEYRDKVIVVSCGTALMPLYKNGIIPDFHAEIEQNRATFDWCCRINDFDYLKQIDLVSCNGIHPDTCNLFRNTYIAFKDGESSTVSSLNLLGEENYEELTFAYPTVSNFVINLFTVLGFEQLYLFGIDLGFTDQDKHHSKQSGYYHEDGQEKYSYQERHNTNIVVPGNFRPTVFTKYEFKVSKVIIERTLAQSTGDCFNTSDGARIAGAKPLPIEDILLITQQEDKKRALNNVKTTAFEAFDVDYEFLEKFEGRYLHSALESQLNHFIELTEEPFEDADGAERYTEQLKEKLFASYKDGKSLLFYYLYGTVNFANSAFSKLLFSGDNDAIKVHRLNDLREIWLSTLRGIADEVLEERQVFDHVSSFVPERERIFLERQCQEFVVTSELTEKDNEFIKQFLDAVTRTDSQWFQSSGISSDIGVTLIDGVKFEQAVEPRNCSIYQICDIESVKSGMPVLPSGSTLILHHSVFCFNTDIEHYFNGQFYFYHQINKASWTVKAWIQRDIATLMIPKLYFVGNAKDISPALRIYAETLLNSLSDDWTYVEFSNYIMVPKETVKHNDFIVDKLGNRGVVCYGKPTADLLFFEGVSVKEGQQQIRNNLNWWKLDRE